jgi:rhodanese-related sulfurtransferase
MTPATKKYFENLSIDVTFNTLGATPELRQAYIADTHAIVSASPTQESEFSKQQCYEKFYPIPSRTKLTGFEAFDEDARAFKNARAEAGVPSSNPCEVVQGIGTGSYKEELNKFLCAIDKPIYLYLSGGIDSELVALALLEAGKEFTPVIFSWMDIGGVIKNTEDAAYAYQFCRQHNLKPLSRAVNLASLWSSNYFVGFTEKLELISAHLATHAYMVKMIGSEHPGAKHLLGGEVRYRTNYLNDDNTPANIVMLTKTTPAFNGLTYSTTHTYDLSYPVGTLWMKYKAPYIQVDGIQAPATWQIYAEYSPPPAGSPAGTTSPMDAITATGPSGPVPAVTSGIFAQYPYNTLSYEYRTAATPSTNTLGTSYTSYPPVGTTTAWTPMAHAAGELVAELDAGTAATNNPGTVSVVYTIYVRPIGELTESTSTITFNCTRTVRSTMSTPAFNGLSYYGSATNATAYVALNMSSAGTWAIAGSALTGTPVTGTYTVAPTNPAGYEYQITSSSVSGIGTSTWATIGTNTEVIRAQALATTPGSPVSVSGTVTFQVRGIGTSDVKTFTINMGVSSNFVAPPTVLVPSYSSNTYESSKTKGGSGTFLTFYTTGDWIISGVENLTKAAGVAVSPGTIIQGKFANAPLDAGGYQYRVTNITQSSVGTVGTTTVFPSSPQTTWLDLSGTAYPAYVLADSSLGYDRTATVKFTIEIRGKNALDVKTTTVTLVTTSTYVTVSTGGSGGCPAPWEPILLADMTTIQAADLTVGMSVWTRHETTGAWGPYEVEAVSKTENRRWILSLEDGRSLVASYNHPMFLDDGSTLPLMNLIPGQKLVGLIPSVVSRVQAFDTGPVVKITIKDAHTYVNNGLLSHNSKQLLSNSSL